MRETAAPFVPLQEQLFVVLIGIDAGGSAQLKGRVRVELKRWCSAGGRLFRLEIGPALILD